MIRRSQHVHKVSRLLGDFPVVAVVGLRQVGKTTLAQQVASARSSPVHHFDLERDTDRARLADPQLALEGLRGLVVLDEIQHAPELFRALRVLADRPRKPARFLVLGCASGELLRQSSESLAGRIAYYELPGFDMTELTAKQHGQLWLRGGLPRSLLARSNERSFEWRREFIRTFLERDLGSFGIRIPSTTMGRFWSMLAHYHGQVLNVSELARSLGVSQKSILRYLDVLSATFAVHLLQPWHANLKKRHVKSPKVYLSDCGLLHQLLGIDDRAGLEGHPKVGASWEGFMIGQVLLALGLRHQDAFFWGLHSGAELDLFVPKGRQKLGFEFKRSSAPKLSASMRSAVENLGLSELFVVYPGKERFPLAKRVTALPSAEVPDLTRGR